ncbi:hypothetical protein BS78_10G249900 [Paspalum vaginatum]|nr:hypothetical protein BS78_10G249900 [Paspalum vaginatum]
MYTVALHMSSGRARRRGATATSQVQYVRLGRWRWTNLGWMPLPDIQSLTCTTRPARREAVHPEQNRVGGPAAAALWPGWLPLRAQDLPPSPPNPTSLPCLRPQPNDSKRRKRAHADGRTRPPPLLRSIPPRCLSPQCSFPPPVRLRPPSHRKNPSSFPGSSHPFPT